MFLRVCESVVQLRCVIWERNCKTLTTLRHVESFSWDGKEEQLYFAFTPGFQDLSCLPLPPCQRRLSMQSHGWSARAALNPHKTLRQEVRQFVYWQISAENHEPYIHRCSVPCYITVVTIPLGKVQKINKQAKVVLTYQGEGSEQRAWCR